MQVERYEHGVPSWVDLGSPDPAASRHFYSSLFGWNAPEGPPEAGGYAVCQLNGRSVAGIGPQMAPSAPPSWMTYVNVDAADAVAALVVEHGGSVMVEPMEVLDVGRMAVVGDPAGAVLGLWQPRAHLGAGVVNEPGTYCWSELVTTDLDGAKAFYAAVFGWGAESHGPEVHGYTEWKVDGRSVGGAMTKPEAMPAEIPPHWTVYFAVADTDAAVARAGELGAQVIMEPTDIEPGRFAVLTDPTGAFFDVLALREGTVA